MHNFYKVNFKAPNPDWKVGVIMISKAFGLHPADYLDWEIFVWRELVKAAKETIKQQNQKSL
jgi:hypothetical protein